MQKIKNIAREACLLLVSILLAGYGLLKKIILPGRNRKGNLLGSLFLFFIAIAEKTIAFEQDILHSSWLIRNRFIKKGLIIATAFLFLISSVEWTANAMASERTGETEATVISPIDKSIEQIFFAEGVNTSLPAKTENVKNGITYSLPSPKENNPLYQKRFLLLCVLRI